MKCVLSFILGLCVFTAPCAAEDSQIEMFDTKIMPLIQKMEKMDMETIQDLQKQVEAFNAANAVRGTPAKEIESLDPRFVTFMLRERGAKYAVVAVCGVELQPCDEAKEYLRELTAQCSRVFLGVVDLGEYPATPRNFLDDSPGPYFFGMKDGWEGIERMNLMARLSPDTLAMAMCPEESNSFRHVFEAFRSIGR
ncbi:MAG: hypothetical protein WAZ27_03955 [Minisyncoccia bacterium]